MYANTHLYSLLMRISTTKKLRWRNAVRSRNVYEQVLRSFSLSASIVEDRATSAAQKTHKRESWRKKPAHRMEKDAELLAKNDNMPVSNNSCGSFSSEGIDSETRVKQSSRSCRSQDDSKSTTSTRKSVEKILSENRHAMIAHENSSDKKFAVTESGNVSSRNTLHQSDERTVVGSNANGKPEYRDTSNHNSMDEPKKSTFAVAFPVTIFSQWWVTCFSKSSEHFLDITFPLNKIHLWVAAYQRVHQDMVGHYVDGQTIGGLIKKLQILQSVVLRGNFRWADSNHIYLPAPATDMEEPNMKCPTLQDSVVQEVLLLILEPIFEPRFSARSHGFRPGRDAHTALKAIRRSFTGCIWFINGDVSILHEEVHLTRAVDSVIKVVKDMRVAYLLKSCLLGSNRQSKSENEGVTKRQILCNWGSCSRLKNLLCNTVLDEFDKWIEGQIQALSNEKHSKTKCSTSPLFKPAFTTAEKSQKLEYVRFGTEFLVACNGTRKDAEKLRDKICVLLKQRYAMNIKEWPVYHISTGVTFLDHNISQKVVHPIALQTIRSTRKTIRKHMPEIKLSLKACRERCLWYFEQIDSPKTVMQIEEILSVLKDWYHYADNRKAIIEYCIFKLCSAYTKCVGYEMQSPEFKKNYRETVQMLMNGTVVNPRKTSPSYRCMDKLWIPEHEVHLRSFAWLQNQPLMNQISSGFHKMQKPTPQEQMIQILWQFLRGTYPVKSDYCWENEVQNNTVYVPSVMNNNNLDQTLL